MDVVLDKRRRGTKLMRLAKDRKVDSQRKGSRSVPGVNHDTIYPNKHKFFPSPCNRLSYLHMSEQELKAKKAKGLGFLVSPIENGMTPEHEDYKFSIMQPQYPPGLVYEEVKGKDRVDIVQLLSNRKKEKHILVNKLGVEVPVDELKGKHVLVCSVFLPLHNCLFGLGDCLAIKYLSSECSTKLLRIVVVAKVRTPWESYAKDVFDHFFSVFDEKILTIPFEDSDTHDTVSRSLGLVDPGQEDAILVVDPENRVLLTDNIFLSIYGAESYPFTPEHFQRITDDTNIMAFRLDPYYFPEEYAKFRKYPLSLRVLLQCDYLDTLQRVGGGTNHKVNTRNYDDKLVGVYLCINGTFFDELVEVQRECLKRNLDFVVVLVCVAHNEQETSVLEDVRLALEKRNVSCWLYFEFNDKIVRPIWRACGFPASDRLIILPPGDKPTDICGRAVISRYGIQAYPFTREVVLRKKLDILQSHTLESLLSVHCDHLVYTNGDGRVPLSHLRGKNVLLYIDVSYIDGSELKFECLLRESYPDILALHPGTQVIILPVFGDSVRPLPKYEERLGDLPWLLLPCSAAPVGKQLTLEDMNEDLNPCVVAFDKKGQIVARRAHSRLGDEDEIASLFDYSLEKEISKALAALKYND